MAALQLPLDLQFRPAYGREDFLITRSNENAVALVDAWPDGWGEFPALTLFGAGGSGKSHLAAVWAQRAEARILAAEEFKKADLQALLDMPHNFAIERLDDLVGDTGSEQKLFHLYNALKAAGRSLLLTAQTPPSQLDFSLKDLASRLRASPAVEINQPDDDLLAYVFAKQLHDRGLSVSDKVTRFTIGRMERSWQAMEKTVAALSARATAEKKGITLPLVKEILQVELGEDD